MRIDEIVPAMIVALNAADLPYMLVGSLSSNYYGIARSTHDADFVVEIPSPEDVIVTKLRWFRRKDQDDIRNVMAMQAAMLDWKYIETWCDRHGTLEEYLLLRRELFGT